MFICKLSTALVEMWITLASPFLGFQHLWTKPITRKFGPQAFLWRRCEKDDNLLSFLQITDIHSRGNREYLTKVNKSWSRVRRCINQDALNS